jgi:hypothetical protein
MAELPRKIPVKPPEINIETKPIENKLAELKRKLDPYIVVIQLNTFTADGTAMINVKREVNAGDETGARQQVQLDQLVERIRRLEKRLELS